MSSPRKEAPDVDSAQPAATGLRAALVTRPGLIACAAAGIVALAGSTAFLLSGDRASPAAGTAAAGCKIELRVAREGGGTEWVRITPRDEGTSGLNLGAGVMLFELRMHGCGPSAP